jgi:hypothetical protein
MVAAASGVALFGTIASTAADAAYVVVFEEVGPNVEAVGGGSLNIAALELFDMTSDSAFVFAQEATEITGVATLTPIDIYEGLISGPLSLGPGGSSSPRGLGWSFWKPVQSDCPAELRVRRAALE